MAIETPSCCPRFDPEPWNDKEIVWRDKPFVKDRIRSFLHIPLNFGSVMKRNIGRIEAADALADEPIVVCDENSSGAPACTSPFQGGAGHSMATLSGTFLTKVFEGPYKDIRRWIGEMGKYVESKNKRLKRLLFYYTTCPKCAKKYGKNYVVLLGQV